MVEVAQRRWGRIDILHYNVGVSLAGGDAVLAHLTEAAFDRIATVNLRGAIMACKQVLPVMRAQRAGVIITISSISALENYPYVAYKATMIAFTQQVAIQNAEFGIRANAILPGLMDTPMAVDTRARVSGKNQAEVTAARDARVPLCRKMGTAWDVANAALFFGVRRSEFHYRCRASGRRRCSSQYQLSLLACSSPRSDQSERPQIAIDSKGGTGRNWRQQSQWQDFSRRDVTCPTTS
jgi:NAD(P)-dependent dehydrogenase (short-subunit alcohol dehydrogenase family)